MVRKPFNLQAWIDEHRDELKPPVGNRNLYKDAGDYIVMMVAGPNARKDYHYNETEELFYQLEGDITLKIINGHLIDFFDLMQPHALVLIFFLIDVSTSITIPVVSTTKSLFLSHVVETSCCRATVLRTVRTLACFYNTY